ncbi:MAG TPA: alpha/beta hydrolase [Planctomycetaceae bacterium]|nr:alpha/beta hydrolase [Planctomycetaceae bacterium]
MSGTAVAALLTVVVSQSAASVGPYQRQKNVVYAEVHGIGLLMDIFVPTGHRNGLGIVDVASGAWHSDRGKLRDHEKAGVFRVFCQKGFTVFAVRPGSVTKFSALEMLDHVQRGIRWVKQHAEAYSIDPNRLGLMGASAGGHLACLAAVVGGRSHASTGSAATDASVRAVAAFFPPTDFLQYGEQRVDPRADDFVGRVVRRLAFPEGLEGLSDEQIHERLVQISPARRVSKNAPPFLLIHGDADILVPLQQSRVMIRALKKAEVPAELIVKKGGGHPWLSIPNEVAVMADWFSRQLAAQAAP